MTKVMVQIPCNCRGGLEWVVGFDGEPEWDICSGCDGLGYRTVEERV